MTRAAKAFTTSIIILGLGGAIYSVYQYCTSLSGVNLVSEMQLMLCLVVLCSICRSLPIYINKSYSLDISILSILASVLTHGPYGAVVVCLISTLFSFEYDDATKKRRHVFNTPFIKTAFNFSNHTLSILLPGILIMRMGFQPGQLAFPFILWPMVVFTLLAFLINSGVLLGMFLLDKKIDRHKALDRFLGLLPNVLAAMPLGLMTSILFTSENGQWTAIIMLLPLLLARYAWKLYLDAQVQYYRLIQAFVSSMEAKDKYTEGHSRRVNQYAELIANGLNLKKQQIETIRIAALLHDIGKIGISDQILLKPDRLTDEEYAMIKKHPEIGVGIVEKVGLSTEIIEIIRHHHERYDGRGYPDGLSAGKTSLAAQILNVADSYDAMTSERPYRKGMPQEVAFQQLIQGKDTQFNGDVVDCLIKQLTLLESQGLPEEEDIL